MTTYKFKAGTRFSGDPDAIVVEFERLRSEFGALQPEAIVEAGADEGNPIHDVKQFLWDDDDQAAHEYRLTIARQLVRAIVIPAKDPKDDQSKYVYTERDYVPLAGITANPGRYLLALSAARRDLESAQRRVDDLLNAAKTNKSRRGDVAAIMLAVEALHTANESIRTIH